MKKVASRSAQWPLAQEFAFSFNEYVVDSVSQVKKTFGSAVAVDANSNPLDPVSGAIEAGLTASRCLWVR
jgi:hypothetical protein